MYRTSVGNDVTDNYDIGMPEMAGEDTPEGMNNLNSQFNPNDLSTTPPQTAQTASKWSATDYKNIITSTDSDLYNVGIQDRHEEKNMDQELAHVSDDYLNGYDQGGFYSRPSLESEPPFIIPVDDKFDEENIKRNPTAAVENPDKNNNELDPTQYSVEDEIGPERDPRVSSALRTAAGTLNDGGWFNGHSESIYNQLERLQECLDNIHLVASNEHLSEATLTRIASAASELEEQIDYLTKLGSEYVDPSMEEYLNSLPGGSLGQNYASLSRSPDFGTDDGSFLYREATKVQAEVENMDWEDYSKVAAAMWVADQDERLLKNASATREAAVYFVYNDTLPLQDSVRRSNVIDAFVQNVEEARQQVVAASEQKQTRTAKSVETHNASLTGELEGIFGNITWL